MTKLVILQKGIKLDVPLPLLVQGRAFSLVQALYSYFPEATIYIEMANELTFVSPQKGEMFFYGSSLQSDHYLLADIVKQITQSLSRVHRKRC